MAQGGTCAQPRPWPAQVPIQVHAAPCTRSLGASLPRRQLWGQTEPWSGSPRAPEAGAPPPGVTGWRPLALGASGWVAAQGPRGGVFWGHQLPLPCWLHSPAQETAAESWDFVFKPLRQFYYLSGHFGLLGMWFFYHFSLRMLLPRDFLTDTACCLCFPFQMHMEESSRTEAPTVNGTCSAVSGRGVVFLS